VHTANLTYFSVVSQFEIYRRIMGRMALSTVYCIHRFFSVGMIESDWDRTRAEGGMSAALRTLRR
jgi:hypothetical protein